MKAVRDNPITGRGAGKRGLALPIGFVKSFVWPFK